MPLKVVFVFTHRIQYFTNLMDELERRGHVQVAALYAHETARINDTGFGRQIVWDNRARITFREQVLPGSAQRTHGPFRNSYSPHLPSALAAFAPDLVHLNGYNTAIQWQAWTWANRHRVPVVARGDGDTLSHAKRSLFAPQLLLSRLFCSRLSHVFYQGDENRAFWLARGANAQRLSWVPCVSDGQVFRRPAFATNAERAAFRERYGAKAGDVVFVVSGKLEPRKRPADAIEALARLKPEPVRLWYLGSGPLEGELQDLTRVLGVKERVTFLGFRNQSEMPAVLQAADALLHPSEADPWPYSILEGAISGLALLLSNQVGSYPDWITRAHAGRVFGMGNIEELARLMREMASDDQAREASQQAARHEAARYTEAEYCQRFETVARALTHIAGRIGQ